MNKLEEKLIELGYKKPTDLPIINISPNTYIKIIDSVYVIYIKLDNNNIKYYDVLRYPNYSISTQADTEIYISAWTILSKDLEELKKYEDRRKKTKLGEMLEELGYSEHPHSEYYYIKEYKNTFVRIEIECQTENYKPIKIKSYKMFSYDTYEISKDELLNALKAYDEMERDLEELRKYEH